MYWIYSVEAKGVSFECIFWKSLSFTWQVTIQLKQSFLTHLYQAILKKQQQQTLKQRRVFLGFTLLFFVLLLNCDRSLIK